MLNHRLGLSAAIVALLGLALAVGCSSDRHQNAAQLLMGSRLAATNGLDLTASPMTVMIDTGNPATPTDPNHNNERYATVALHVTATGQDTLPQDSLAVMFQTSAGMLLSGGAAMLTDTLGQAHDSLRVYQSDPDSITVGVTDGTRLTQVVIHKLVLGAPVANAGADQTVECTGDSSAQVTLDGSGSTDPNNDITSYQWFENFGTPQQALLDSGMTVEVVLPDGAHVITLLVTDATGGTDTDTTVVTVGDTQPPVVTLSLTPSKLWPPNHKMAHVHADLHITECSAFTVTLESVTSNEPDNGLGDGDTTGDIQGVELGTADTDFDLRAERSGKGSGRVYTVVYKIVDAGGVETLKTAWVTVPHDNSGKK